MDIEMNSNSNETNLPSLNQYSNDGNIVNINNSLPDVSVSGSVSSQQELHNGNYPIGFNSPTVQSNYTNLNSSQRDSSSSFSMPYDPPTGPTVPTVASRTLKSASRSGNLTSNKVIHSCSYCGLVLSSGRQFDFLYFVSNYLSSCHFFRYIFIQIKLWVG